jgi:hypothetical protein
MTAWGSHCGLSTTNGHGRVADCSSTLHNSCTPPPVFRVCMAERDYWLIGSWKASVGWLALDTLMHGPPNYAVERWQRWRGEGRPMQQRPCTMLGGGVNDKVQQLVRREIGSLLREILIGTFDQPMRPISSTLGHPLANSNFVERHPACQGNNYMLLHTVTVRTVLH